MEINFSLQFKNHTMKDGCQSPQNAISSVELNPALFEKLTQIRLFAMPNNNSQSLPATFDCLSFILLLIAKVDVSSFL